MNKLNHGCRLSAFVMLLAVAGFARSTQAQCGGVWTSISDGPGANNRYHHKMTFDSTADRIMLAGGYSGSAFLNDAWLFDGTTWSSISNLPNARSNHTLTYDPIRNVTVCFGGQTTNTPAIDKKLYEWNGTSWSDVTPVSGGPSNRRAHLAFFDEVRGTVVIFGGMDAGGTFLNDMWEWDGASWSQITGTMPSTRAFTASAYDSVADKLFMFGGAHHNGMASVVLDDTWSWDGTSWTQVTSSSVIPPGRTEAAMCFDPRDGVCVMFGGSDGSNDLGDTWIFNGFQWILTAQTPSARRGSCAIGDGVGGWQGVVLQGGRVGSPTYLKEVFTWSGIGGGSGPIVSQSVTLSEKIPGDTLNLSVTATGMGTMTYQWHFNGSPLSNGGDVSGATSSSLTVTNLDATNSGLYEVVVSNSCGSNRYPISFVKVRCPSDFDDSGFVDIDDFNAFSDAFEDGC